jgi:hypothetical protein
MWITSVSLLSWPQNSQTHMVPRNVDVTDIRAGHPGHRLVCACRVYTLETEVQHARTQIDMDAIAEHEKASIAIAPPQRVGSPVATVVLSARLPSETFRGTW